MSQNKEKQIHFGSKDELGESENRNYITVSDAFNFIKTYSYSRDCEKKATGIRHIHYGDIHTKFPQVITDFELLPEVEVNDKNPVLVKSGDIVIADASENYNDLGNSVLVQVVAKIISGLHTHCLRVSNGSIDPLYFVYYTNSSMYKRQIRYLGTGISVLGISKSNLNKIRVPHVPFIEQQQISNVLSSIDNLITTQKVKIKLLSLQKEYILDLLFSNNTNFQSFHLMYKKASEGGTPSTANSQYYVNGKIPFANISDISKNKYLRQTHNSITIDGLNKSSAWVVPSNSLIYTNGATIGEVAITTFDVATKQGILGIIPKDGIDIDYFYYVVQTTQFKREVKKLTTKGTMPTIYLKDMNNILVPKFNANEQQKTSKILSQMDNLIEIEEKKLELLEKMKKYHLQQFFD